MKILFVNTGPWGTGSFTLSKCLAKELLKLGHQVKIFFPDANFATTDRDEYYNNTELYEIWDFPIGASEILLPTFPLMITDPHPRNPNPIIFKDLTNKQLLLYEKELYSRLSSLINSFKPDIIECQHIWYPCWVLRQIRQNYIVTAHHSDQKGFREDIRIQKKAILSAQAAQKIIAISEFVQSEIIELYHIDQNKIIIIDNSYDQDVFKAKEVDKHEILSNLGININSDARIISFAGKLSLAKGIDILLQANKLLDPTMNIHIIAMGAGEIESIYSNLDQSTYSLDNIHFVGQQTPENVANIHNISLLSIMPSREEGFGISCLEAMACGLPLVVSCSGGPEYFAVGEIIEKESAQQLADAIMKILKLPSTDYQTLRKQALSKVESFSSTAITAKHVTIYETILAKN